VEPLSAEGAHELGIGDGVAVAFPVQSGGGADDGGKIAVATLTTAAHMGCNSTR